MMVTDTEAAAPQWVGLPRTRLLWVIRGGLADNLTKAMAVLRSLGSYAAWPVVRRRLERLKDAGAIEVIPSFSQILVGGQQMMLGTASDETRIFYEARGIDFTFHNLRRFLDHPASMMDPVGFFSDRDTIIHHIFQSTHRHPVYDFQLLLMYDGGLAELARRAAQVEAGTDPAQQRFEHLVEDPTYFDRLFDQIRAFVADPATPASSGGYHVDDPAMMLAMDQFKDLRGFTNYAAHLDVNGLDVVKAYGGELWKATFGRLFPRRVVPLEYRAFDTALITRYFPEGLPDSI